MEPTFPSMHHVTTRRDRDGFTNPQDCVRDVIRTYIILPLQTLPTFLYINVQCNSYIYFQHMPYLAENVVMIHLGGGEGPK